MVETKTPRRPISALPIWLCLAFAFTLALAPGAAAADREPFRIYMAVWRGCEDACKGFQDYLAERNIPVEITLRDAGRDKTRLPSFVAEVRRLKPDLVVTWGTSVSLALLGPYDAEDSADHIRGIPAVFMIVADPIGAKIARSYGSSGRPLIAGTRNPVPEDVQIRAIRSYFPAKRIGVIYNTNELNAVLNAKTLRQLSERMDFELVERKVPSDADGAPRAAALPGLIGELAGEEVDFIYVGSSSFISSNRDLFTSAAIEAGLPVAASSEVLVRESGALLAIGNRYYDIGQLAGFQAEEILVKGQKPIDLPVRSLSRYSFIINMETARRLELYPPIQLLRFADLVNK